MDLLDDDAVRLDAAGDDGLERRLLRDGPKAEHVHVFLIMARAILLPLRDGLRAAEKLAAELVRLGTEILVDHLVARPGVRLGFFLTVQGR